MIKKYLKHRKKLLENEIEKIEELSEMSQVSIKQIDAQINNLKNEIDEVENMEDSKKETYDQIDKYAKEIAEKMKEIKTINECLNQLEGANVSRETFKKTPAEQIPMSTQAERTVDQSIKTRLNFCKGLVGVDDIRAKMELEEIIKGL